MYTLFNTKSIWPSSPAPTGQVYFTALPGAPIALNPPAQATSRAVYYQMQPGWFAPAQAHLSAARTRGSSDDVFLPEGTYMYHDAVYNYMVASHYEDVFVDPVIDNKRMGRLSVDTCQDSQPSSCMGSPHSSKETSSRESSPERSCQAKLLGLQLETSSNISSNSSSNSNTSASSQPQDDSILHSLFPSSLNAALNEDPPEPVNNHAPLKTSSPIQNNSELDRLFLDPGALRKRRGRFITSSSSDKCPRFSENGICDDLDQCDKILIQNRMVNPAEDQAKRREEFLLILEAERERQRKLVVPKHAPKMNCKFCKNNGESSEVYSKHRLHYNEKTVCPLLRHYVCRLCNSTGDFAHTIRHCPFNDRKDKMAWKATFLA